MEDQVSRPSYIPIPHSNSSNCYRGVSGDTETALGGRLRVGGGDAGGERVQAASNAIAEPESGGIGTMLKLHT
eukprot:548142-Amorphochlora_amoeboformis.AAC.1